jgi:NADH:ubiquinone reductase (H+-translocating)
MRGSEDQSGPEPVSSAEATRPQVVIVGAGFGGISAAKRLMSEAVDLTVIDRQNHHLFQPLLYQVATAALSPADIAMPIRSLLHRPKRARVTVLLDEATGVDKDARCVRTVRTGRVPYDWLILATGSTYSYFGHDAWAEAAPGLKTVEDALAIRNRLLSSFECAETTAEPEMRNRLLTFVMIGGGPTGVEMAGALAELAKATLARDFVNIDPTHARIVLVEAGPRLLAGFPEDQSAYAERALRRLGVEVLTSSPVEDIDNLGVRVRGERIEAAAVIWCAGVQATPVGEWLGAETARASTVKVTADLSLPHRPEIFVIGDAASVRGAEGGALPGLAPVAKQEGRYAAEVIAARIAGREPPAPFRYRDWGSMATVGRSAAVGQFGSLHTQGFFAWLLWGAVHLGYLVGFRNRMVVLVSWLWAWATYARGARLITGTGGPAVNEPGGIVPGNR